VRTYQIHVNDKDYAVEIDDLGAAPVTVRVNGKTFQVTLTERTTSAQVAPRMDPYAEMEETYVPVVTSTFVDTADVSSSKEPVKVQALPSASGQELEAVVAPMPGKVMDIAVKAGDQVGQGDTLCNLEAMKMKSPIRSSGAGTIAQVLISEGQNVNYGDVLFTLS
jgi:biotin carboxyl carrier protein